MGRSRSEREKREERVQNSRRRREEQRGLDRHKQELGAARRGHFLDPNVVDETVLKSGVTDAERAAGSTHIKRISILAEHINTALHGGSQDSYRLRRINSGTSEHAAGANHNHSVGFKSNFTQEQRKALLADVHDLEALDLARMSPVEAALVKVLRWQIRMTIDEPYYTAEELVDFIDNGDPLEVHEWRVENEQEYHAVEMLLIDPAYRVNAYRSPTVRRMADALDINWREPVTEKMESESHLARMARRRELEEFPEILEEGRQHEPGRHRKEV